MVLIILYNVSLQFQFLVLQIVVFILHLIYLFYLILSIFNQKIKSSVTIFGKIFRFFYKLIQSKERFDNFIKKNQTSFEVYKRWRFLRNNRKSALFQKNVTTILSVQNSKVSQQNLKRRISQFISQNQVLIQSSFSNSLNKMNSSFLETNSIQTPNKRLVTKSNFGGEKKQLSFQTDVNEKSNFRGQNTILSQLNQLDIKKNKSIITIPNDTSPMQNKKIEQNDQYELSFCGQVKFVQIKTLY
ncbi:transmembrane protein, putative (macronuclear) [Tetrahymena thermophila SB210]|uniref:Transmembrane protein, putative n=1 Tax=Tetrahymena thermophila (strain SB210) TaxID=312017 RepID=Q24F02_TETTS|nr:transmembrane protein, putative [Tetrahymena thermophila SB210]EAS06353.2 transmembrane protein, putative [Tetrahymena thermophila SB210]|eukprot:XP_001026598.2 transmembrane protein, putative [Tetrahymena thermophila SB210]